ncbi:MAG: DUF1684 domain-containing protein [Bacteroidota bacterium]|nr:DUF1684 domain-containing protein [Bacteroidota bacterium]
MFSNLICFKGVYLFFISCILFPHGMNAQNKSYHDSIISYQQHYVDTHEVVTKADRKFIQFYDINEDYLITADFKKIDDKIGFEMNTSSGMKKKYFTYGVVTFKLFDSVQHLFVYQSAALMKQEKYKDYLFIPFGDATSGFTSYGGGRYLDLVFSGIKDGKTKLDFNKAYNPYCAYVTGYNCPIPPKENLLTVAIKAGEENYAKPIH